MLILVLTVTAAIITSLIALIAIFIVKRRNYLRYKITNSSLNKDAEAHAGYIASSPSVTSKPSLKSSSSILRGEWKTNSLYSIWPFKREPTASVSSDEKILTKQDYEVKICFLF